MSTVLAYPGKPDHERSGDSKRGELRAYHRRPSPSFSRRVPTTAQDPLEGAADVVTIVYGGRRFVATSLMAISFARQARRLIDRGETELVALLHAEGVDLLLIADTIPVSVGTGFVHLPAAHR